MGKRWPNKDPNEVLDYAIDWSQRLAGDIIDTSTFTVPSGIVINSQSKTNTMTTVWLSGGSEGVTYDILNRIITNGGRTMDQTVELRVKSK
jgi:frataxin-like iron-binding protein CyaY